MLMAAQCIERSAEDLTAAVERLAWSAASRSGVCARDLDGSRCVALAHPLADIGGVLGVAGGATTALAMVGAAALGLGARLAALRLRLWCTAGACGCLSGGQLSHADSSSRAWGIT